MLIPLRRLLSAAALAAAATFVIPSAADAQSAECMAGPRDFSAAMEGATVRFTWNLNPVCSAGGFDLELSLTPFGSSTQVTATRILAPDNSAVFSRAAFGPHLLYARLVAHVYRPPGLLGGAAGYVPSNPSREIVLGFGNCAHAPEPPTGVVAVQHGVQPPTYRIAWFPPPGLCRPLGYTVELFRVTTGGEVSLGRLPSVTDASNAIFTPFLQPGSYRVKVAGVNHAGASTPAAAEFTVPGGEVQPHFWQPRNFAITQVGAMVELTWTGGPAGVPYGYVLLVSHTPNDAAARPYSIGGAHPGFRLQAPAPGRYYVRLFAQTPLGQTSVSNEVTLDVR